MPNGALIGSTASLVTSFPRASTEIAVIATEE